MGAIQPALTLPESLDAGVAAGTLLLALATFGLAWQARKQARASADQARASTRLAELAEQQLELETRHIEATTEPSLTIASGGPGKEGLIGVNSSGDGLAITLRNDGASPGIIEGLRLTVGRARLHGETHAGDTAEAGGGEVVVEFPMAPEHMAQATSGDELLMQAAYHGPGGSRKRLRASIKAKDDGERWIVVSENHV